MPRGLFLLGNKRSGSSLLARLLSLHPPCGYAESNRLDLYRPARLGPGASVPSWDGPWA